MSVMRLFLSVVVICGCVVTGGCIVPAGVDVTVDAYPMYTWKSVSSVGLDVYVFDDRSGYVTTIGCRVVARNRRARLVSYRSDRWWPNVYDDVWEVDFPWSLDGTGTWGGGRRCRAVDVVVYGGRH